MIDRTELAVYGGGLLDYITDTFLSELEQNLFLRSPMRFDFSPADAGEFHPASHLTINSPECRIPARAPLCFDTFIKFLFENFYLDAWKSQKVQRSLAFAYETECLSAHDRGRAYLNWTNHVPIV